MRKRFSEEQIIAILRDGEKPGAREETCRKYGVSEQSYYRWKRKYQGMSVDKIKELKRLQIENARLSRLVTQQAIAQQVLQEELEKKRWT